MRSFRLPQPRAAWADCRAECFDSMLQMGRFDVRRRPAQFERVSAVRRSGAARRTCSCARVHLRLELDAQGVPTGAEAHAETDDARAVGVHAADLLEHPLPTHVVETGLEERVLFGVQHDLYAHPPGRLGPLAWPLHTGALDAGRVTPGAHLALAAAAGLRDRGLDRVERRPAGALRTHKTSLPAIEVGLVAQQEEEHRVDRGVTREVADGVAVDVRLRVFVRRTDALPAVVRERGRGDSVDLPAELVEPDFYTARTRSLGEERLGSAAKGVPERLLDTAQVGDAGVRPAVALQQRISVVIRIRVVRELVHDRPLAAARPIRLSESVDEADGGGRDVVRSTRPVAATG